MKTTLSILALAVSLVSTNLVRAENPGPVTKPAAGTPLRKAVLDGLRPAIEADLGQKVIFIVDHIRVSGDWAFVQATPVTPESKPIDFGKTKHKERIDEGLFDGDTTFALLRKKDAKWVVLTFQIGPTDVCWAAWDGPPYHCPRIILPYPDNNP